MDRDLVGAFLPADQGHALMKAAGAVMEVHSECSRKAKEAKAATSAGAGAGGSVSGIKKEVQLPREEKILMEARASTRGISGSGVELYGPNVVTAGGSSQASVSIDSTSAAEVSGEQQQVRVLNDMLNKAVLADPAGTIFSAAENVLTEKRNFDDDTLNSVNAPVPEGEASNNPDRLPRNSTRRTASVDAVSKVFDGK